MNGKLSLALGVLVLLGLLQYGETAQMARGYDSQIGWNPWNPHYLMRTRDGTRTQRRRVDYGWRMRKVPTIFINPNIYDWEWGNPSAWSITVKQVDVDGFWYELTAHEQRHIYTIFFNWVAIVDEPTLQVKYYTLKTPGLEQRKAEETFRINFDYEHEVTPLVWTSFNGMSFVDGPQWKLYQNVENVDTQGFTYRLSTNGESRLNWVQVAVFSIVPDQAYLIHGDIYNYNNRRNQLVNGLFYESYIIQDQYTQKGNPPQPFSCVQGFQVSASRNMRLQSQRDDYFPAQFKQVLRLGKWADTELQELQYTQMIYVPSVDRCAKFYAECSYQGDVLFEVCEGAQDNALATELHGFDVRSFQVPKGTQVTIYQKENFQGVAQVYEQDQPCVKEWKW